MILLGACGTSEPASQPAAAPAKAPAALTGHERFAWTQPAEQLAGVKFAVYADGTRVELPDAVCHAPQAGQAECDAPLPPLPAGKHSLEVVSWRLDGDKVVESARSPAIAIEIAAAAPANPKTP